MQDGWSEHDLGLRSDCNHMASFAPWQLEIYYALVLDVTMVGCFLELQDQAWHNDMVCALQPK